jgi:uncharacterized damage-inducible protein DinB
MPDLHFDPPTPDQYAPHMAGYVARVGARDPIVLAHGQIARLEAGLAGLSEERALYRYAPGKWSIKEVLGHITDTERVFAYRLLRVVRGDTTPLPGFEQDSYVENGAFDERPLSDLIEDLRTVRVDTLRFIDSVRPDAWERTAFVNGVPTSAKALLFMIAGHLEHHLVLLGEHYGM